MSFDLVTVRVGSPDKAVDIPVYRELLSSVSPYFRGAFEGDFKEAAAGVVPLTDVTEATFRIFLQWAHAQMHSCGSDVSIPDHSIFPRTASAAKVDGVVTAESNTGPNDSEEHESDDDEDESDSTSSTSSSKTLPKCFDKCGYQSHAMSFDDIGKVYFNNEYWMRNYQMSAVLYLKLYIFADKYSVHQLRDDILTVMLGQASYWDYYPDPEQTLLTLAYNNLPDSAMFHQFMALITVYFWLPVPTEDAAARLRRLSEWQPDFALDVSVKQAQMLQKNRNDKESIDWYGYVEKLNSCIFHEHLVLDKDACRERIKNKIHVFAEMIEACAKEGISMVKELEGN
jgi:hypothetical protein